jgi:hypothetical protein
MTQVNVRELTVGVIQVERDCPGCARAAAADFRQPVLESVRQVDPDVVLDPRHGIENRLAMGLELSRHDEACSPRVYIDVELDRQNSGGWRSEHMAVNTHHIVAPWSVSSRS